MSIIWFRFVISNSFFICFLDLICVTKKLHIVLSRVFFNRDISIIIFGDCFNAFFNKCSSELADDDFGDLISYFMSSINISAVCRFDSLIKRIL